jgi:serine/threonine protein kinase
MCDLLLSLDTMSRIGVAHRDIKPANILMCNQEMSGLSVKVADFGMSGFAGVDGKLSMDSSSPYLGDDPSTRPTSYLAMPKRTSTGFTCFLEHGRSRCVMRLMSTHRLNSIYIAQTLVVYVCVGYCKYVV